MKLPWIGSIVERARALNARVDEALEARGTLRMHRGKLAARGGAAERPLSVPIPGRKVANGFEQHSGKNDFHPALFIAAVAAVMLLLSMATIWGKYQSGQNSLLVTIACAVVAGAIFGLFIFYLVHQFLKNASAEGWLTVREWPLKPGAEVRMAYRGKLRMRGKIQSIDVALKCAESITWKAPNGSGRSSGYCPHNIVAAPTPLRAAADGSATAEWTLRVPREGPPSFAGSGGSIRWAVTVEMKIAGAADSSQSFPMLVIPEMAS